MSSYANQFHLAFPRTASQGLPVEDFEFATTPGRLTPDHGVVLMEFLQAEFSSHGLPAQEAIAFRCAQVSELMQPHVESVVGRQAMLTVGTVSYNGIPLIANCDGELHELARSTHYHVWLTMPWLEIVDFTLELSIAVGKGLPTDRCSPLAGYPDAMQPYRWHPLYVGAAAVEVLLGAL